MDTQTLTIKLAAEVAEFISKIKGVESLVTGAAQRMRDSFSGVWATLGASVSVAGLGMFVKAAINAADQLDELSQRYGISAKELSGLQLAFKQSGVETDAMASSMGKLQRAMADGNQGLSAIGVTTRNTDGSLRGTSAVLLDVADKFARMEDGAGKTALAVEIFGKSGADMVPLLNSGSDGIKDMIATAERLGLVLENDVAAQAGNFNDTLELIGMGAQGVGRGIAAKLLPTLQSLGENFLTTMTSGDRLSKTAEFLANVLKGLYIGALAVIEVFSTLGKTFGSVIGAFFHAANGDFKQAWAILKEGGADIANGWKDTAKQMSDAWNETGGAAVAAMAATSKGAKTTAPDLKALEAQSKAAAKALDEQRKEQEAQAKLVAELSGVQADYLLSLQRLQAQRDKGNLSEAQYVELVTALIAKQPMAKKLMDDQAKATAALAAQQNQAFDDYFDRLEKERLATEAQIKTGRTTLEQLQFENTLLGMNATERAVANAMRQLETQGVVKGTKAWGAYADAVRSAVNDRETQSQNMAFWQSIESTAKGVWTDVADSGVSAFERIGKTIKASVLDALWQMTGRQWLISIGASMGVPGAAQAAAANAGTNALGMASNGFSLYNAGSSALGATLLGNGAAYGAAIGTTSIGAGSQAAMLAAQTGEFGAAGFAATAQAAGTAASTIMSAIPYVAAFVAVAALIKSLDDSGTMHSGGAAQWSSLTGTDTSNAVDPFGLGLAKTDFSQGGADMAKGFAMGVGTLLDSVAVTFGKKAGYSVAAAFADDSSKDKSWGALLIKDAQGKDAVNWNDSRTSRWASREFADGKAGAEEYSKAVSHDVRNYLLSQTPEWADAMLQALGDAPSIEQLGAVVGQINMVRAALIGMGKASAAFADMSDEAASALIKSMGGAEAAAASLSGYYANFYSESERAEIATATLTKQLADLGVTMPASRDAFRSMIDAAMKAGDPTLAGNLLNLQDEFAALVPVSKAAADAVDTVTEAVGKFIGGLRKDGLGLQADLAELQGSNIKFDFAGMFQAVFTPAELRRALATEGMTDAEVAAWDFNEALRAQIQAFKDAKTAAAEAADQRDSLDSQVLNLLNDSAAMRAKERAAIADSNLALFDLVTALGNLGSAASKVAELEASLASSRDGAARATQGLRTSIEDYVRELTTGRAGTASPLAALSATRSNYINDLRLAKAGDADAAGRITRSANTYIEAQKAVSASGGSTQSVIDQVLSELGGLATLPGLGAAEDSETVKLLNELKTAVETMSLEVQGAIKIDLINQLGQLDLNADKRVDWAEFKRAFGSMASEDTLKNVFATLDADGSKSISTLEAILVGSKDGTAAITLLTKSLAALQSGGMTTAQFLADLKTTSSSVPGLVSGATTGDPLPTDMALNIGGASTWVSSGGALSVGDTIYGKAGGSFSKEQAIAYIVANQDDPLKVYNAAVEAGISSASLDALMGWQSGSALGWAKKLGMPSFDVGTNYVPRDMVAQIHQGEAIVPKAYNPAAGGFGGFGRGMDAMVAEIKNLRAELSALRTQQTGETQAAITTNVEAQKRAAAHVASTVSNAVSRSSWADKTKPVIA